MNDFFIHQAVQQAVKTTEELKKYLADLKALTNGDLAVQASKDLSAALESNAECVKNMTAGIEKSINSLRDREESVCADLAISLLAIDRYQNKLRRFLIWGWTLFFVFLISGVGGLCYVISRVH